ncbi:serine/arginine repetitive matrix protein 2 isoform X2 [Folsomia candida]|uniref:serine/arginine repetitive matrix protein 2 isoform X2 n=1 Tax=Folsomia candida TaxID=158441 RepID=UPI000B8F4B34|nr:serine/arginine repetitive matrix protein 2 isoform X2 [Folsomia candida]
MNISTLEGRTTKKNQPPPHPKFSGGRGGYYFADINDMNYNHGYSGGPPPGYGPPQEGPYYGGPPPPDQNYYDPNYDPNYAQPGPHPPPPVNHTQYYPGAGYPHAHQHTNPPPFPPPQQQPPSGYYEDPQQHPQPQFARRETAPHQQQHQEDTRILRNPHPHIPLGSTREETYDPSLPTYNATPIYNQPQLTGPPQKTPIVAPTLSSIFEIAAERVSKKISEQHQRPEPAAGGGQHVDPRIRQRQSEAPPPPTMNEGGGHYTIQQRGAGQECQTEIITGVVTQMQEMFGMVSSEIFFQTSTVVGALPAVGDKVVVEAERVSGMPFKFNGKRVQILSKDLTSEAPTSTGTDNLDFERRQRPSRMSMDFGPLPELPNSLNLTSPKGEPAPPLKSILKRNPPPPPMLSDRAQGKVVYRPESPIVEEQKFDRNRDRRDLEPRNSAGKPGPHPLFSLDLRNDFPIIKPPIQPLLSIQDLYPELLYVKNNPTNGESDAPPTLVRRRSRTRSRSKERNARPSNRRSRTKTPPRRRKSRSKSPEGRKRSHSPSSRKRVKSPNRKRSVSPPSRKRSPSPRRRRSNSPRSSRRRRSNSPVRIRRSKSRSPGRTRRSKSRSPGRTRRSKSHSPGRTRRSKSRSPGRTRRSKSKSPVRIRRSKSPIKRPGGEKSSTKTSRRKGRDDEGGDEIQIISEKRKERERLERVSSSPEEQDPDQPTNNPFGAKSEIKAVVQTSSLFPRFPRKSSPDEDIHLKFSAPGPSDFDEAKKAILSGKSNSGNSSKPKSAPPIPIKFQIGTPPAPVQAPKIVPNPTFAPNSGVLLQNPSFSANPSTVVAQVERAVKLAAKKKKKDEQAPAYVIKSDKPTPTSTFTSRLGETKEQEQARRIAELKSSLQAKKLAQIQAQEQILLEQKAALEAEISKNRVTEEISVRRVELQKSVEGKLKDLRSAWEAGQQANGGGPTVMATTKENEERIREDMHYRRFLEEEKRLQAAGDTYGISELYKREDRRRRRVEEDRLVELRMEEMRLKKEKNWEAMKQLRESFGGTAERETEIMRLREMRKKEEMADEEAASLLEEQEVFRRAVERSQRGSEGPVRRLVMDTQMRQLAAAQISVGDGEVRGERLPSPQPRKRSPSPRVESSRRRRSSRSRSRSRTRVLRRSRSRSPRSRVKRHSRSRSRDRGDKKSRTRRDSQSPSGRRDREMRSHLDADAARMALKMEEMQRHEEELMMREREIQDRMQFMQQQEMLQQQMHQEQQFHHHGQPQYFDDRGGGLHQEVHYQDSFLEEDDHRPEAVYMVRSYR